MYFIIAVIKKNFFFYTELGDTYYSLTKQAQENFYILSNPNLFTTTALITQTMLDLIDQFVMYLQRKVVTADSIVEAFPMLPSDMKLKYKLSLEKLLNGQPLSMFGNDQEYIRVISLLKIAINEFGDDHLKKDIQKHTRDLQQLRRKVPLQQILVSRKCGKLGRLPSSYAPLSIKLQKDPTSFTLADLEAFRLEFASEFQRCLSGPSSLILHGVVKGSIIIVLGVLRKDATELNKELLKDSSREFFERNNVDQVSLQNCVVFDNCKLM